MKNSQKGFIVPLLIVVVAVLVIGGGIYVYKNSSTGNSDDTNIIPKSLTSDSIASTTEPISATTTNQVKTSISDSAIAKAVGSLFEVNFVKDSKGDYVTSLSGGGNGSQYFSINRIVRGDLNSDGLEDVFVWTIGCGASCGSNFAVLINQKTAPVPAFVTPPEGFISSGASRYSINDIKISNGKLIITAVIPQFDGQTVTSILSYKLVGKNLVKIDSPLPTTCVDQVDQQSSTPVITSLSSNSGPVGTTIEIRGCNFAGFESDLNVWVTNSQGVKGILYSEPGSTSKLMKIVLKPQACQTDESYRGLPCAAYLNLTPGTYKIYTIPWSKKSNEATFTIK